MEVSILCSIGERIRMKRKELGLTLKNVAQISGMSIGNLSDIERGQYNPSSKNLSKLASALQCTGDWIIRGDTEISNSSITTIPSNIDRITSLLNQLTTEDQEEIEAIINLKITMKIKKDNTNSLTSSPTKKSSETA